MEKSPLTAVERRRVKDAKTDPKVTEKGEASRRGKGVKNKKTGTCKAVFIKLWSMEHRWSPAVRQVVHGGPQAVLEETASKKLYQILCE
jgi:hypothetical protein